MQIFRYDFKVTMSSVIMNNVQTVRLESVPRNRI